MKLPPKDELLEDYTFSMGETRGRQARVMDLLTDVEVLLGQHLVYVHAPTGKEKWDHDLEAAVATLRRARSLLRQNLDTRGGASVS